MTRSNGPTVQPGRSSLWIYPSVAVLYVHAYVFICVYIHQRSPKCGNCSPAGKKGKIPWILTHLWFSPLILAHPADSHITPVWTSFFAHVSVSRRCFSNVMYKSYVRCIVAFGLTLRLKRDTTPMKDSSIWVLSQRGFSIQSWSLDHSCKKRKVWMSIWFLL